MAPDMEGKAGLSIAPFGFLSFDSAWDGRLARALALAAKLKEDPPKNDNDDGDRQIDGFKLLAPSFFKRVHYLRFSFPYSGPLSISSRVLGMGSPS